MVDTLHIWAEEATFVSSKLNLNLVGPPINTRDECPQKSTMTIQVDDGTSRTFYRAYRSDKKSGVSITAVDHKVWIQCSLSHLFGETCYLLRSMTQAQAKEKIQALQIYLHDEVGIRVDLQTARISRVDLFRDIQTDHPFAAYMPLLQGIRVGQLIKETHDSTITYRRKKRAMQVYDKSAQLKATERAENVPENILRWEYRLLKASQVKHRLGLCTVEELLLGWDRLRTEFDKLVQSALESTSYASEYEQLLDLEELRMVCETNKIKGLTDLMMRVAIVISSRYYGGVDNFKSLLKRYGMDRRRVSEFARRMRMELRKAESARTHDLRSELLHKLVGA